MKLAGAAIAALVAAGAALILTLAFTSGTDAPSATTRATPAAAAEPTFTPVPATWMEELRSAPGGRALLLACLDDNRDGRLNSGDAGVPGDVDAELTAAACVETERRADYYVEPTQTAEDCAANARQLLIVAVASAGSDLWQAREGESLGLLRIVNEVDRRAVAQGYDTRVTIAMSAIFGAVLPQTNMERWMAGDVRGRLEVAPCLRVVLLGHSHGGVTVTSAAAMLEGEFAERIYVVAVDRSAALYDRAVEDFPRSAAVLNVYQLNEGWHGEPIDAANVMNVERSQDRAPIAPSDGGGPPAVVTHKTLDDSPDVQRLVPDAVMGWLAR